MKSNRSKFLLLPLGLLVVMGCAPVWQVPIGDQDVVAPHGMVASAHPLASQAGVQMLQRGGNAVDAAVAAAFMLGVAEPNASGIGGGGFMLIKMADSTSAVTVDHREVAPASVEPAYFYEDPTEFDSRTSYGHRAVCVPGTVAGLTLALRRFGRLSLAEVLEPAISAADTGLVVNEKLHQMIVSHLDRITCHPETAATFLTDGLPPEVGSKIRRADLAATYRLLAQQGADAFYRGPLGAAICAEMKEHDGWITEGDLAEYRPLLRTPVRGRYRGFELVSVPPPSSGGLHLLQLLNIVEGYDLRALGHNSADYVHVMAEAMKQVYADRARYTADPAFTPVPVELLLSKKSAKAVRRRIDRSRARFDYQPTPIGPGHAGTSHLSVVDGAGNAVALTQTINDFFGSGVQVPGTGILLNDQMADFSADPQSPNAVAPGKRPQSSMAPTLLLRNGKVVAALGTPGGARIISALAQIIVNIVDFGMSIDQAIEAPRFHCEKKTLYLEGRFAPAVVEELRRRGHPVQVRGAYDVFFGGAQGILVDWQRNRLLGGADSRRFGVAIGY